MHERQLQFRVGLFVLCGLAVGAGLVLRFTDLQRYWRPTYRLSVSFEQVSGVYAGTPVRMNGVAIGAVSEVIIDDGLPGALLVLEIDARRRIRLDSQPLLQRSLFGEASIEFAPGSSDEFIPANRKLKGQAAEDPLAAVARLELRVDDTLAGFQQTSDEIALLARNLNGLVDTHRGGLGDVVARAAVALETFTTTMQSADKALHAASELFTDPLLHQQLRETAAELPRLARETRETISAAREAVVAAKTSISTLGVSLDNLAAATSPLAERSDEMADSLAHSVAQLDSLLTELNTFAQLVNGENGSLQKFARDPELYENMNRSAAQLAMLLRNIEPVLEDIRVFSDKVARHPELMGVSGALKGSSGIKDAPAAGPAPDDESRSGVQQASGRRTPRN